MSWVILGQYQAGVAVSHLMILTDTGWLEEDALRRGIVREHPGPKIMLFEDKDEADRVGIQHVMLDMRISVQPYEERKWASA